MNYEKKKKGQSIQLLLPYNHADLIFLLFAAAVYIKVRLKRDTLFYSCLVV